MSTIITGKDDIAMFQMIARKGALKLELLGMKRNGRSAYSIIKKEYGFKGSRASVLKQLERLINAD